MTGKSRALVLSGGGFAGGAWMLALLSGLREAGLDLAGGDLLVGTSAGARTAAQLTTGSAEEVLELFRSSTAPSVPASATLGEWVGAVLAIARETPDRPAAAKRIANLEPLDKPLVTEAERMKVLAHHVPAKEWPEAPLLITAVDAATGERVTFDRGSGVALLDAVAASGALPGIYPLTTIDGRRYADGGVHSLYSADLAEGNDVVVVVTPQPMNELTQRLLDAEVRALGESQVELLIASEESVAAMGPDPASLDHAAEAVEAGFEQARREAERLAGVWT